MQIKHLEFGAEIRLERETTRGGLKYLERDIINIPDSSTQDFQEIKKYLLDSYPKFKLIEDRRAEEIHAARVVNDIIIPRLEAYTIQASRPQRFNCFLTQTLKLIEHILDNQLEESRKTLNRFHGKSNWINRLIQDQGKDCFDFKAHQDSSLTDSENWNYIKNQLWREAL